MNHDPVFLRQPHNGLKKTAVLRLSEFQLVHVFLPTDPVPAPESAGNILGSVDGDPEKPGFQVGFIYVVFISDVILQEGILNGVIGILFCLADAESGGKHSVTVLPECFLNG